MKKVLSKIVFIFFVSVIGNLNLTLNASNSKLDSLLANVKPGIEDTIQAKNYQNLAWYYSRRDFTKAMEYLDIAFKMSRKLKYAVGELNCLNTYGVLNARKGNYILALNYLNRNLALGKQLHLESHSSSTYGNIGLVYKHLGNFTKAVEYFLIAESIYRKNNDNDGLSSVYNNLGNTYTAMDLNDDGLAFHKKALKIRMRLGNEDDIATSLANAGSSFVKMKMADSALLYFNEASRRKTTIQDLAGLGSLYNNLGSVYSDIQQMDSAKKYLQMSYDVYSQLKEAYGLTSAAFALGKFYFNIKKYKESEKYLLQGLKIALDSKQLDEEKDFYEILARSCYLQNRFKESIEYYYKFDKLNRQLTEINSTQKIADLKTNFEIEKQQIEIEKLQQKQTIQDLALAQQKSEINRQRLGLILSSISVLLALSFVYVLYKGNKQKKEDNKQLSLQKQIIETKNKEVMDSIHYAKRIQKSLLPSDKYMQRKLSELINKK